MDRPEFIHAARMAWTGCKGALFTLFDPDFAAGENLLFFLQAAPEKPSARLRYLAVTGQCSMLLPGMNANPVLAPGLHYFPFPQFNIELHLWVGDLKEALKEFSGAFDAVLHPDASQDYKRRLQPVSTEINRPQVQLATLGSRVAVIGAGIAGSSVALALCRQGVQVDLFEAANQPAAGASGNWVGAFHPHITRGDSPLSRLTRLGFEHTVQALEDLTQTGLLEKGRDWDMPGHFQSVPPEDAERTRDTLQQLDFPVGLVHWVEPGEHLSSRLGGLFFPRGGWVKPAEWVKASLHACGELLTTHYGFQLDKLDKLRAAYGAVVVCCAEHSIYLAPLPGAQVSAVKGQISKLNRVRQPEVVLSGESYAIAPPREDWMVVGATYERPVLDLLPTAQADEENINRFRQAFPDWPLGDLLDHRCAVRSVWHDRLPAIGPVPGQPGVYMSTGFASRGLLWAALGGWLVADYCLDQPLQSRLLEKIRPRAARQQAGR